MDDIRDYTELPIAMLVELLELYDDSIKRCEKELKLIKSELDSRFAPAVEGELKKKDDPFGVVTLERDEFVFKFTTPKKVVWDQEKLAQAYEVLSKGNESPDDYISLEYNVPESKYKAWPQSLKDKFIDARTVSPQARRLTVERKEVQDDAAE